MNANFYITKFIAHANIEPEITFFLDIKQHSHTTLQESDAFKRHIPNNCHVTYPACDGWFLANQADRSRVRVRSDRRSPELVPTFFDRFRHFRRKLVNVEVFAKVCDHQATL